MGTAAKPCDYRSLYVAGGIVLCVAAAVGLCVDRPSADLWWVWVGGGVLLGWAVGLVLRLRRRAELPQEDAPQGVRISLPWLYVLHIGWFIALVTFGRAAGQSRSMVLLGVGAGLLLTHFLSHGARSVGVRECRSVSPPDA